MSIYIVLMIVGVALILSYLQVKIELKKVTTFRNDRKNIMVKLELFERRKIFFKKNDIYKERNLYLYDEFGNKIAYAEILEKKDDKQLDKMTIFNNDKKNIRLFEIENNNEEYSIFDNNKKKLGGLVYKKNMFSFKNCRNCYLYNSDKKTSGVFMNKRALIEWGKIPYKGGINFNIIKNDLIIGKLERIRIENELIEEYYRINLFENFSQNIFYIILSGALIVNYREY